MNEHERTLAMQAQNNIEAGETVSQSILTGNVMSEAELEKWLIEGVGTELDNLGLQGCLMRYRKARSLQV